jgi:hypothetical protein
LRKQLQQLLQAEVLQTALLQAEVLQSQVLQAALPPQPLLQAGLLQCRSGLRWLRLRLVCNQSQATAGRKLHCGG